MQTASLESEAVTRTPLTIGEAYSRARIERIVLASGRSIVLKHLPAGGDWLTRATRRLGRTRQLWDSGLPRRLTPAVDHGTVDAAAFGSFPSTLMDGDLEMSNLGFTSEAVVLLDRGTLTCIGPRALDLAWNIAVTSAAIDATLDELPKRRPAPIARRSRWPCSDRSPSSDGGRRSEPPATTLMCELGSTPG
jgi:hypothetical protein